MSNNSFIAFFLLFLWIVIRNIFIPSITNICNSVCLPTSRKTRNRSFKIRVISPSSSQWTLRVTPSVTNTHHDSWSRVGEPATRFSISFMVHPHPVEDGPSPPCWGWPIPILRMDEVHPHPGPLILLLLRPVTSPACLPAWPPAPLQPASSPTYHWAHHHSSPAPVSPPSTKQASNY